MALNAGDRMFIDTLHVRLHHHESGRSTKLNTVKLQLQLATTAEVSAMRSFSFCVDGFLLSHVPPNLVEYEDNLALPKPQGVLVLSTLISPA